MKSPSAALLARVILLLLLAASPAFSRTGTTRFASGLSSPLYLTAAPGDPTRVFVVENFGDIEILDATTGEPRPTPFLTVANIGGANSLMSMAFHPDYTANGFLYVYYQLADGTAVLARYARSELNADVADPTSELRLLEIPLGVGHVGGWIGFGPDGYLYCQVGDGGIFNSFDAANRGQSTEGELLGNVLRIDVDGDDFPADPDRNYAIPATNPFLGVAGEDEIWAIGLRNPWRGSFDRLTGDYYIADVGQDTLEEINFELAGGPGGRNYGWRIREGSIATPNGDHGGPQPPGGIDPIYEYSHGGGSSQGMSVTGGYVYRGPIAQLQGHYFFGDFSSERIWSIQINRATESVTEFIDWTDAFVPNTGAIESLVSFGEDAVGNLYLVDYGGEIFRVDANPEVPGLGIPAAGALLLIAVCVAVFNRSALHSEKASLSLML